MTVQESIDIAAVRGPAPAGAAIKLSGTPDDKEMLRAAVELTRDISTARPGIYWPDMLGSAALGYAALAGAILAANPWTALALGILSALALYRALLAGVYPGRDIKAALLFTEAPRLIDLPPAVLDAALERLSRA